MARAAVLGMPTAEAAPLAYAADVLALPPDFRIGSYADRIPLDEESVEALAAALRTAGPPK